MTQTISPVIIKDDRTGISYAISIHEESRRELAMKRLKERMDYDYFESLPAKTRAEQKKINLDFTCPNCLEKTEVSSRKEKITSGFLFLITTRLIDIFRCQKCNKEFYQEDLNNAKDRIWRQNNVIENFENWKDAKKNGKNPPEFASLDKVDEYILSELK